METQTRAQAEAGRVMGRKYAREGRDRIYLWNCERTGANDAEELRARAHTVREGEPDPCERVRKYIYISMCVRMYGWEEDAGSSLQYDRAKKRTNESESSAADD